jgi:hypothetical protein
MSAVLAAVPARCVEQCPAPRREPPFDDELQCPALRLVPGIDRELPFPTPPRSADVDVAVRADLPEPSSWARRLLLGLAEAAAGRRPLNQVSALLSPSVCRGLGEDFALAARRGGPHWLHRAVVRTVHVSEPCDGVAELAATVQAGRRIHAVALRLEARHGRWRCTRLQMA